MYTNAEMQDNITISYPPFIVNVLEPDINIDNLAPYFLVLPPAEVIVEADKEQEIELGYVLDKEGDEFTVLRFGV